jgi:hypothetical protein
MTSRSQNVRPYRCSSNNRRYALNDRELGQTVLADASADHRGERLDDDPPFGDRLVDAPDFEIDRLRIMLVRQSRRRASTSGISARPGGS